MNGLPAPLLLALLGTALLAVAIFAPRRVPASPGVSLAPPLAAVPVERWTPPADVDAFPPEPLAASSASWPALVDPRAAACDVAVRLALVDALACVRSPWARDVLARAYADEFDDEVRATIRGALAGQPENAYPSLLDSSAS
jgi:hypothetical protein